METTTLFLVADPGAKTPRTATQSVTGPVRDAVRRALRKRDNCWVAMALHLSRLPGSSPRPHHRRIAKAVLNDAASRREGQLFTMLNGDYVLLFPSPDGGASLWTTLGGLFAPDAPDASRLLSKWLLPADLDSFHDFLDAVPQQGTGQQGLDPDIGLSSVTELFDAIEPSRIRELLERQTGVLVALSGANRVVPLFREIRFSIAALEARAAASGHAMADPFLFRHLIASLGDMMLNAVIEDLGQGGAMLAWAGSGRPMLHLNLSLEAIMSPRFDDLQRLTAETGIRLAVEIAFVEAYGDANAYVAARKRLRAAEVGIVLDDLTQHALAVTRPAALQPDLLKLDWSRQLPQADIAFDRSLNAFGPAKIILSKADTEDAVRWGIARGIRRFQGRHVDAILAASRIANCPEAGLCTVRRCAEREIATTASGRAGCNNLSLLDAASPAHSHFE